MPVNQDRGNQEYLKYNSMSTEELEELLRLDSEAPEGEETDVETLLCIMEVLAQRKRNSDKPGKTALEAWQSFQQNYLPTELAPKEETPKGKRTLKQSTFPWVGRVVAATAAIVLLVCIPLAASAISWEDVWNAVATWAKGTFSFVTEGMPEMSAAEEEDNSSYSSLKDVLSTVDGADDLVPNRFPDGYVLEDIVIEELPGRAMYLAMYSCGEKQLLISVKTYLDADPERMEVDDKLLEVYEAGGMEYYILENKGRLKTAWAKKPYECYISGDLTVEEMKMMLDSIGKG